MSRRPKHNSPAASPLADILVGVGLVAASVATATRDEHRPADVAVPAEVPHAEPSTSKGAVPGRIDLFQQRRRWLAVPVGVIRKYSDDRAGRHVTMLAYFGFLSLFPAMLVLVTILGFILEGHPGLRSDIADSAQANFPIVGDTIASSVGGGLRGSALALVIGLVGALWAGMGVDVDFRASDDLVGARGDQQT